MADFLAEMAAASRARAELLDEAELALAATRAARPPRPELGGFKLIAEVKRSSPSEGALNTALNTAVDPVAQALAYARGGAAAVSVLTEPSRFGGSLDDLVAVAEALRSHGVPAMRKDFLVDRRQVLEARAAGAGGVLLIAAILDDETLVELMELARGLAMFVLLEAFDEAELSRLEGLAPVSGPDDLDQVWLGLNCRDLRTLQVDPGRLARVPRPRVHLGIAESGLAGPADAARVWALGWRGALVGTALMREPDPEAAVRRLKAVERASGPTYVKLCGLRTPQEVRAAVLAGASHVGFIVVDSPRQVALTQLPELAAAADGRARTVAVMRDFDPELYRAVAPHVHAIQCRSETVPETLPPLPEGVPRPLLVHVLRDGPELVERVAAVRGIVLIDATEEGSGRLADLARVQAAGRVAEGVVWMAGGLTPGNVAERIRHTGVLNVDVASGIESSPGAKDPDLMRRFVIAARTAHLPSAASSEPAQ